MGSLGYSISMIASLSPTLMESRLISSMGCVSMTVAPSFSSVSVVSSSLGTTRRDRTLKLRSSMSPGMVTTLDSDVGVGSSATTKKVSPFFLLSITKIVQLVCVERLRLEITEKLFDVLRRAGADVTVASVEQKLEVEGSSGTRLLADVLISKCADQVYDLVALPGGMPGAVRLRDCEILEKIMKRQAEDKRLYGAISMAPAITLLPWGLLTRKRLPTFWAVKTNIQISGELTTSRGPGTSFQFALSLAEQLFGETTAKSIEEFLVLIPVANGSEAVELVSIADVLRRAKVDVTVSSVERSLRITAFQGTKIITDKLIGEAAESSYDLIILPVRL
ncbi:putative protein [Arabidopsis thaliana]|nr:putative protein [Arabidopsis thaliana]CAA19884.1 putative protein [Arabidopsis thaliana]CAB80119.1 putative protein [Arabidopsis thaliana]